MESFRAGGASDTVWLDFRIALGLFNIDHQLYFYYNLRANWLLLVIPPPLLLQPIVEYIRVSVSQEYWHFVGKFMQLTPCLKFVHWLNFIYQWFFVQWQISLTKFFRYKNWIEQKKHKGNKYSLACKPNLILYYYSPHCHRPTCDQPWCSW